MAAMKQQRPKLSSEDKGVLKDMMNKMEDQPAEHAGGLNFIKHNLCMVGAAGNSGARASTQATTNGAISDRTGGSLTWQADHSWDGSGTFPQSIANGKVVRFQHSGPLQAGSKAGVVYSDGKNQWLLAFHNPDNQVYVETGAKAASIDWDTIEVSLDASTNESSYVDPTTKAKATATIDGGKLVAVFSYES